MTTPRARFEGTSDSARLRLAARAEGTSDARLRLAARAEALADAARGFLLQPSYRVRDGVPVIQLYGALEGGGGFLVEDDRFRPYFFVREADIGLLARERRARAEPSALRSLDGNAVARVEVATPGDVPELRMRVEAAGGVAYESDLRFPYRYLIDRGLRAAMAIRGEGERLSEHLVRFRNPELAPTELRPALRLLSLDIETALDASRVWSVALAGPVSTRCTWPRRTRCRARSSTATRPRCSAPCWRASRRSTRT